MSKYYIGDLVFYSDPREELEHHGILGQKWGIRRYQNRDGTYTSEGLQRRYGDGKSRLSKAASDIGESVRRKLKSTFNPSDEERAERRAKKEAKTAQKQAEREARAAAEKERILKSGSAEEVLNISASLSPNELNAAVNRLRNEDALKQFIANDKSRTTKKSKSFIERMQSAEKLINSFSNIYSTVAKFKKDKADSEESEREKRSYKVEQAYARKAMTDFSKQISEHSKNANPNDPPWFPDATDIQKVNQQVNAYHLLNQAANGKFNGGGKKK